MTLVARSPFGELHALDGRARIASGDEALRWLRREMATAVGRRAARQAALPALDDLDPSLLVVWRARGRLEVLYPAEVLTLARPGDARAVLAPFLSDAALEPRLRALAGDLRPGLERAGRSVVDWAGDAVAAGDLHLAWRQLARRPVEVETAQAKAEEGEAPAAAAPAAAKTWIELQVVWADTGEPIPQVHLRITPPGQAEAEHVTDWQGLVRLDPIDPGSCSVRCKRERPTQDDTLVVVAEGEPEGRAPAPAMQAAPPPGQLAVAPDPTRNRKGAQHLIELERHRVKKGESIKSLADAAGLKWQELATYNWRTSVPKEINERLRDEVGCTKRTRDGKNYLFDDSDHPGIVLIPHEWERGGLATAKRHVFQVNVPRRFFVILENERELRIPEAEYEVELAGGKTQRGRLGLSGVDAIEDPPYGPVAVTYLDHDDIRAKSGAALAHRALQDRDYDQIWRILKNSRPMLEAIFAAYARYFDDRSGKGLRHDIEREITDPEAREAVTTFLLIAGLPVEGDVELIPGD